MNRGQLFNKTLSAQKILETLLAAAADQNPNLCIGALRDFKWSESSNHADVTTVEVRDCNVGGHWVLEGSIYVDNEPTPHDHRDGSTHFRIRREGTQLFPFDSHYFVGRCYQFGIGQDGYKIACFEKKPAMSFIVQAGDYYAPGFETFEDAFGSWWFHAESRRADSSICAIEAVGRHPFPLRAPEILVFAKRVGLLDEDERPRLLEVPLAEDVVRAAYREAPDENEKQGVAS